MTCRHTLSLLEDFIDGELAPTEADEFGRHLRECRACRGEYDSAARLKDLLHGLPAPSPGADYWEETTRLIMARTGSSRSVSEEPSDITDIGYARERAFVRSLVSVAASLLILFSAIAIGSGQGDRAARLAGSGAPITVTAYAQNLFIGDTVAAVTHEERSRLATGMLLIGPPGFLGKFAVLPDITAGIE